MPTLKIHSGAKAGQSYELLADHTIIGRDQFCDIVLPVHSISRQHARIGREGDNFYLEDLGSLNGTFVNGQRIAGRTRLKENDRIHLYETLITFHTVKPPRTATGASSPTSEAVLADEADRTRDAAHPTKIMRVVDATADTVIAVATQAKLKAVLGLTRNLGRSLAVDEFLANILDSVFEIFPEADRGYILLADKETGQLNVGAMKQIGGEADGASTVGPINRLVAERVIATGEGILSSNAGADTRESALESAICSAMSVPLIGPSRRPLGVIHVETYRLRRSFSQEDLEVLISVATVAGQAVEHARVHEVSLRLDRRERELVTAREVQRHFLPQRRPDTPSYSFFDYYCAADDVGGDYFGYLALPDGRLAIAVGDVSGKGVSAALLMARLCSEVRYCLATSRSPVEAVEHLNEGLSDPTIAIGDRFVTFLLCVLDPRQHVVTVVNAGHMPPLVRRAATGKVEQLGIEEAGPPLGFDPVRDYADCTTRLEADDVIVMYTDGISEAVSRDDDVFGIQRVCATVAAGPADVEQLGQSLLGELQRFLKGAPQSDDICLLCISRVS